MTRRILHLRGSSALLGAERVVLELSQWSLHFGYEPFVAAPLENGAETPEFIVAARGEGIPATTLPCDGRLDLGLAGRLRRLVESERIDLVHCHGYKEDFYAAAARLRVPLVATNHLWKQGTLPLRFYNWLDARVMRRFDQVVAVSDPILGDLRRAGLPERKISRIPNGVDMRRFDASLDGAGRDRVRASLGLRKDALVIGMLSSLTPEKGHRFALEALGGLAGDFPRLQLCVVGDGPLRATLEREAAERGVGERVLFPGRRSDVPEVLRAFDVFLLPSLIEGLPMALLEAMAAGLPVVASDVGDVCAAVDSSDTGFLVPPGSAPALVVALRTMLGDPALREQRGRAGRQRVAECFSSRAMTQAYCSLYSRVLVDEDEQARQTRVRV